ncbi:MAG: DUF2309 domain-containing protein [Myxococcales bacterium]|nr:DUF2309 domain-containing protein [Myxococcales bacterium]
MNAQPFDSLSVADTLRAASSIVAPVWPLDRFVAVNPYLGLQQRRFEESAGYLEQVCGVRSTLPLGAYAALIERGELSLAELDEVLEGSGGTLERSDVLRVLRDAASSSTNGRLLTVADVADEATGGRWSRFVVDHLGGWLASYFDEDYAAWQPRRSQSLFRSWKAEAEVDRTPEIEGARGFREVVRQLPDSWQAAAAHAAARLGLTPETLTPYVHCLAMRLPGWCGHAARLVWERRLYADEHDDTLVELLTVLLAIDVALHETLLDGSRWSAVLARLKHLSDAPSPAPETVARVSLQVAYERTFQKRLFPMFELASGPRERSVPRFQAVFCIDVRSEIFRRHLEASIDDLDTLGFAGFFGFPVEFTQLGHGAAIPQCPVLLRPSHRVLATAGTADRTAHSIQSLKDRSSAARAWQSFKLGAISCFSFVGPVGLAYLPKLITDAFGLTRPTPLTSMGDARHPIDLSPTNDGSPAGIPLEDRIQLAASLLSGMSLTQSFARLVLLVGHGSSSVNNPHAAGLDCGACGGRAGGVNARVAVAALNDPAVRLGVGRLGVRIPRETLFVAAQHDTTTDEVNVFDRERIPSSHLEDLEALELGLRAASEGCRAERARRLDPTATGSAWFERSRDWAQVRPEWGLAGCAAFVAAPRHRTASVDLEGRAFLHSYSWKRDEGFRVLETIMTAPMVVATWINLQYYASSVDPDVLGAGNKTLHNVVGGNLGVLEGNTGDLRVGLPWQSVHDGHTLQHEPLRLNVFIEAPAEAMNAVIAKHESVRQLLDNGWIHLIALDESGRVSKRYIGGLRWRDLEPASMDSERGEAEAYWSQAS